MASFSSDHPRSRLCAVLALICSVLSFVGPAWSAEEPRPNFVIINIDDLGYADIGPFGSATRTPHLDRMAWPVLTGAPSKPPRKTFHYFRGLDLEAVRSGVWKLHLASGELFNLEQDIGETKNAASAHPEAVSHLRALAATMQTDLGTKGIGPGCRALGRDTDPKPIIAADGTVRAEMAGVQANFP